MNNKTITLPVMTGQTICAPHHHGGSTTYPSPSLQLNHHNQWHQPAVVMSKQSSMLQWCQSAIEIANQHETIIECFVLYALAIRSALSSSISKTHATHQSILFFYAYYRTKEALTTGQHVVTRWILPRLLVKKPPPW